MSGNGGDPRAEERRVLYERVCESYHGVDDFRMKLLGLLPVATGSGVFLLLSTKGDAIGVGDARLRPSMAAIGAFGLLFTAGLFAYELFGIKKCHYLIETGRRLESQLKIRGQFRSRPLAIAGRVNEPLASALIYPACMAAWIFVGLVFVNPWLAAGAALALFIGGLVATVRGARLIGETHAREERVLQLVAERGRVGVDDLRRVRGFEGNWVDGAIERLEERGELERDDDAVQPRRERDYTSR